MRDLASTLSMLGASSTNNPTVMNDDCSYRSFSFRQSVLGLPEGFPHVVRMIYAFEIRYNHCLSVYESSG